ncbi:MAG: hypothetical protein COS41_00845 [Elusimicrobia bacterium CG03_land_8_20_14_0_80_50_18]|nr:MAG: hypothetical protein COS41_00845 [Elusimicrobia bacterium CG03_land_8_20_14_0_80_50_18]PIX16486.1 MAG: hypothetical protein COZ72_00855 [Elusimicrobia bacterium CG_4_8_14_3_um_filter_50_9]
MKNIFLLGRPGCGKSIVYRTITDILKKSGKAVNFERIDDFPILMELHDGDVASGRTDRFMPTDDGGFKIMDPGIWDAMLAGLNRKALAYKDKDGVLAIEFSRPDNARSLGIFSDEILKNATALYIDASFETCVSRNEERTKRAEAEGIDAHFVSRKEMEETYPNDDGAELPATAPVKVIVIKNDDGVTPEDIEKQLLSVVDEF